MLSVELERPDERGCVGIAQVSQTSAATRADERYVAEGIVRSAAAPESKAIAPATASACSRLGELRSRQPHDAAEIRTSAFWVAVG
jgi:hypothetical protein